MPELPEVETTRRGLLPSVRGRNVEALVIREPRLRWPIPRNLAAKLVGRHIHDIRRRGKYLLFDCSTQAGSAHLLVHLGMTGTLRIVDPGTPPGRHDHVDVRLSDTLQLRFNDPRRFGAMLWVEGKVEHHPLLAKLGVEPLSEAFDAEYLFRQSRSRRVAIKQFIMDSHVVTGVGNIYANEALFAAGIHPARLAGRISLARLALLTKAIRGTLERAIKAGGSSIRDYVGGDGKPGYFQLDYRVYGRAGMACSRCSLPIRVLRQGQRSTFYCTKCQT